MPIKLLALDLENVPHVEVELLHSVVEMQIVAKRGLMVAHMHWDKTLQYYVLFRLTARRHLVSKRRLRSPQSNWSLLCWLVQSAAAVRKMKSVLDTPTIHVDSRIPACHPIVQAACGCVTQLLGSVIIVRNAECCGPQHAVVVPRQSWNPHSCPCTPPPRYTARRWEWMRSADAVKVIHADPSCDTATCSGSVATAEVRNINGQSDKMIWLHCFAIALTIDSQTHRQYSNSFPVYFPIHSTLHFDCRLTWLPTLGLHQDSLFVTYILCAWVIFKCWKSKWMLKHCTSIRKWRLEF